MQPETVRKYNVGVRILHWAHSLVFLILGITGLVLLVIQSEPAWLHTVHGICGRLFAAIPVLYLLLQPVAVWRGLKQAFVWTKQDLLWLKSAPGYYLMGREAGLPPQGFLNAGQKVYWLLTLVTWLLLSVSGILRLVAIQSLSPDALNAMVRVHDISFAVVGILLLGHIYLAVFHPLTRQALGSMFTGRISAEYARKSHSRWYNDVAGHRDRD